MDNMVFRQINFDSIILGTLISADCGGVLLCSKTEQAFRLNFRSEQNEQFKIIIEIDDIKKIFKTLNDNQMILDFKLKPSAIRRVGDLIKKSDFYFQISKNADENKFQLYLNDISNDDVSFIEKFFSSIDVFDENVAKITKEPEPEPEPEQQQTSKIHKSSVLKHRKKKLLDCDPEDGSQDYLPQKRPRKQSFSNVTADCEVIEEAPKRSLRVRNRDEVNLCEDMSEEAQLKEALKRSLKGVDQTVIESLSHIEDSKSEQDLEHEEIYDNVDKTIELFTYNTSNGDIIVRMEDYLCLSRNEYLSDVIIDFYLHYIYNVKMTPEQREKTLIIGTHFYTLYATSSEYSGWNDGLNAGLNAKEKRYKRIEGILKNNVNIFEKDYIIMPLMDHNHWFLAIVCFPKLNGSYTIDGNVRVDESEVKRNPKKVFQAPIKSSCILILDSVKGNGSRRTVAINHIKNFLEYEWMNKYQQEFQFDVKCLNGHSPKVPLQMNNVDCGCFILEFMERFFVTSPVQDLRFPIDLGEWFSSEEVRSSKRREIAQVIQTMMESTNNQVELPKIRFYGDRKRKTSKPVQFIDLENNNGNSDDTFRVTENGNGNGNENGNENGNGNGNENENSNGNNNDENFNNNNDFYCLDSNNILQNGNVIQENQDVVHNIPRDDELNHADVDRVTTQEIMEYEQECCVEEAVLNERKTDSIVLDTSDELDFEETQKVESETAGFGQEVEIKNNAEDKAQNGPKLENVTEIVKNDAKIPETLTNGLDSHSYNEENSERAKVCEEAVEPDTKFGETDQNVLENNVKALENVADVVKNYVKALEIDTEEVKSDAKILENDTKGVNSDANNDAEVVKTDAKIPESDSENIINEAKILESDAEAFLNGSNVTASISKKSYDSDIQEIHRTPEKIDLTLDDNDEEEPNYRISDMFNEDKMDIDPEEQNNDQQPKKEQNNQKSENMQSIADRISQSINLKDTTVLLD